MGEQVIGRLGIELQKEKQTYRPGGRLIEVQGWVRDRMLNSKVNMLCAVAGIGLGILTEQIQFKLDEDIQAFEIEFVRDESGRIANIVAVTNPDFFDDFLYEPMDDDRTAFVSALYSGYLIVGEKVDSLPLQGVNI